MSPEILFMSGSLSTLLLLLLLLIFPRFTHDLIHQTLYDQIPSGNRRILHKTIGESLLSSAVSDDTIHLLAVDQINMFCKDGNPNLEERSNYAQANATAAKLAIAASSFEKGEFIITTNIVILLSFL